MGASPVPRDAEGSRLDRTDAVLRELVPVKGYVELEYLSRLRLLAAGIVEARPKTVLDVGCGFGALSLALSEGAGCEVTGVDILRERLTDVGSRRRARGRGTLQLLAADADHGLPFRAGTFDVAVATEVLEHLEHPERLLSEARRVLRKGGGLFVTTPHSGALPYRVLRHLPTSWIRRFGGLTREHLHPELLGHAPSHPDHHRREGFTLRELQALGQGAGLAIAESFTYRIPLPDKVMVHLPSGVTRRVVRISTKPIPLGLECYAHYLRRDDGPTASPMRVR